MESFGSEREGNDFSDALEDFSIPDHEAEPGSSSSSTSTSSFDEEEVVANSLNYDLWAKPKISIDERRDEFTKHTGFDFEHWRSAREEIKDLATPRERKNVPLREKEPNKEDPSSSRTTPKYGFSSGRRAASNLELLTKSRKISTSSSFRGEEMSRAIGIANWVQQHLRKRGSMDVDNIEYLRNKERKDGWLKKLSFKSSSINRSDSLGSSNPSVHVKPRKKQWKELSGLYLGQEFGAHKGYILAMKFSSDGRRLATGGQDGVVLVWEVGLCDKSDELDVLGFDQSCLYVSTNGATNVDCSHKKEDGSVMRKLKKMPERACIISPKKFFRIRETPLHYFHEHQGAVLDISWSEKGLQLTKQYGCGNLGIPVV